MKNGWFNKNLSIFSEVSCHLEQWNLFQFCLLNSSYGLLSLWMYNQWILPIKPELVAYQILVMLTLQVICTLSQLLDDEMAKKKLYGITVILKH